MSDALRLALPSHHPRPPLSPSAHAQGSSTRGWQKGTHTCGLLACSRRVYAPAILFDSHNNRWVRKMGLQLKEFSKSFLANKWWTWDDNSTRRPGSKVGRDASAEGRLGRAAGPTHWLTSGGPRGISYWQQAGGRKTRGYFANTTKQSSGHRSFPAATASLFPKVQLGETKIYIIGLQTLLLSKFHFSLIWKKAFHLSHKER